MTKHPVCFWEINAEDAEPLANFYKRVLEWEIGFNQQRAFYSVKSSGKDSGIAGGIFTGKGNLPPHRALYVEVEAIDEIMTRVPLHGGKVALEPYDFEGVGRLAFFRDPEGHMIGLIQRQAKAEQPDQTEVAAEPAPPEGSGSISVPTAHVAGPPDPAADAPAEPPSAEPPSDDDSEPATDEQ